LGQQARGVVAAGLRRSRAALARARVVVGQPDGDRADTTGEVGAGRAGDDVVRDLVRGPYAEERLLGEHEGPQVETRLPAVRHPFAVDRDELFQRLEEVLDRELRKREAV